MPPTYYACVVSAFRSWPGRQGARGRGKPYRLAASIISPPADNPNRSSAHEDMHNPTRRMPDALHTAPTAPFAKSCSVTVWPSGRLTVWPSGHLGVYAAVNASVENDVATTLVRLLGEANPPPRADSLPPDGGGNAHPSPGGSAKPKADEEIRLGQGGAPIPERTSSVVLPEPFADNGGA